MLSKLYVTLIATLSPSVSGWAATPKQFDVVVCGTTASGVIAAVAAARDGMRVALVGRDQHLGGMVSGGLSSSDKRCDVPANQPILRLLITEAIFRPFSILRPGLSIPLWPNKAFSSITSPTKPPLNSEEP